MAHIKQDNQGNVYLDNPWYIDDVHQAATDMDIEITDEEAESVLYAVANNHDANIGINWDVFYYHIDAMKGTEDA